MCDQCEAIDIQIRRYRWLETHMNDPRTLSGLEAQIRLLKDKRTLLHTSDANSNS